MEFGNSRTPFGPHLLVKNMVQFTVGILAFWFLGFAFAYGDVDGGFIGTKYFLGGEILDDGHGAAFSTYVLAGTMVLFILNLAVSERIQYHAYVITAFLVMVLVWPIAAAWIWGGGFLATELDAPAQDNGGTITIYLFAGAFSVVAVLLSGKRPGKFEGQAQVPFVMGNNQFYVVGCLLTILGIFALNSSTGPMAMANSWVSGAAASAVALKILTFARVDLESHYITLFQGFIAGLVGVSTVGQNAQLWIGLIIGILSGLLFVLGFKLCQWLKLDDAVNVTGTFFLPAFFGGLWPGFFDDTVGVFMDSDDDGNTLVAQIISVLVVTAWAVVLSGVHFAVLKFTSILGLPEELATKGLEGVEIVQKGFRHSGNVKPTQDQNK